MLDIIFMLLLVFTIILMLYGISERNLAFVFLCGVMYLVLALFTLQGIEIPYELFNATSGHIETGVHNVQTNLSPLSYLFMGLGAIMFLLFVTFTLETLTDYRKIK